MEDSGIIWAIGFMVVFPIMSAAYTYFSTFIISKIFIKIFSKKTNYAQIIEEKRVKIGKSYALLNAIYVFITFGIGFLVFSLIEEQVLNVMVQLSRLIVNICFVIYLYRKPFATIEGTNADKWKLSFLYVAGIFLVTMLVSFIF